MQKVRLIRTNLDEHDRTALQTALRVAAERYKENDDYLRKTGNNPRMADQFKRQRDHALELADQIAEADNIIVEFYPE